MVDGDNMVPYVLRQAGPAGYLKMKTGMKMKMALILTLTLNR